VSYIVAAHVEPITGVMLGDPVTQELVNGLQQFRVARLDSHSAALARITSRSIVRMNATL
jgi:hypothetical protein